MPVAGRVRSVGEQGSRPRPVLRGSNLRLTSSAGAKRKAPVQALRSLFEASASAPSSAPMALG